MMHDILQIQVIILKHARFVLDKFLIWGVLWKSILKKGRLDETASMDPQ